MTEQYSREIAINFADWCMKLSPKERCTVHPPAGSGAGTGLYQQSTEELFNTYLRRLKQRSADMSVMLETK